MSSTGGPKMWVIKKYMTDEQLETARLKPTKRRACVRFKRAAGKAFRPVTTPGRQCGKVGFHWNAS